MYVKPLSDLKVRDIILGDFLPKEGREVSPSSYWDRREAEKSIEVVIDPKPIPAVKSLKKGDDK